MLCVPHSPVTSELGSCSSSTLRTERTETSAGAALSVCARVSVFRLEAPHPEGVSSSRYVVPGDRERKQRAPQSGVDAVMKHMLVGVVVWKRDAVD